MILLNIYYFLQPNDIFEWLQIIIPSLITVFGWYAIYRINQGLNRKIIKEEKKIAVKIEAYNFLKPKFDDLFNSLDDLTNKLNHLYQQVNDIEQIDEGIKELFEDNGYISIYFEIDNLKRKIENKNKVFHKSCNSYKLILNKFNIEFKNIENKSSQLHKSLNRKIVIFDQLISSELMPPEDIMEDISELLKILAEYDNLLYSFLNKIQQYAYGDLFKEN